MPPSMESMSVRMESKEGTSRIAESKPRRYHAFLNHRGPDVKKEFVSHLDAALRDGGLRTFLDANDIEVCRDVDSSINEALEGSCVFVAIFSKRFAESKHCLNELCKMMELTQLDDSKKILPVFYHVHPGDLRRIEDGPFKEAFRRHKKKESDEQILKWKDALSEITDIMGLDLAKVNWNEAELVRRILAEVRRLINLIPGAIEQGDTGPPEHEPNVTFSPGDPRLNILVLGDPVSVEAVVSRLCGAGRRPTPVEDHVNLRECKTSSPPMCLYSHTRGINSNDFRDFRDIRTFVKVRNEKWSPTEVEALWSNEVCAPGPRIQSASPTLFPDSTLRLHMVWYVCRNLSDLPNHLKWPQITKRLCDIPVQILVIDKQRTQDLDMNLQKEFNNILEHGSSFFPHARKFVKDLIVKVALQDDDLKGELLHKCLAVKTRVEIESAAQVIWELRRKLGPAGKFFQRTFGGPIISKKVSLSLSGEFVLHFLCAYWDIPQESLRCALNERTNFISQAPGNKVSIEPYKFVEFCLIVAGIILHHAQAQANARNPNVSSESSLDQLLKTEARDCYNSYFAPPAGRPSLYYDKMVPEGIRQFLERILKPGRGGCEPCPVEFDDRSIRSSCISNIMKLICPR